jgi:hypothetical protein
MPRHPNPTLNERITMTYSCKFPSILATLFALALLSGCANYYIEKHFERNPSAVAAAQKLAGNSERATVFFFRKRAFMQSLQYIPTVPSYFAVDGKLTAAMPLGSHVVLSLEPGKHTFTRITVIRDILFPTRIKRDDSTIDLRAGNTYYLGAYGFAETSFGSVDAQAGNKTIDDSELARFIHQPLSVDAFLGRVTASDKKQSAPAAPAQTKPAPASATNSASDLLPSAAQLGSFLEGIAAVAIVGLTIFAVAKSGASSGSPPYPPPNPPVAPAAYVQPAAAPSRWQNSSGIFSEIVQSSGETTVYNRSTGIRYRIEDGRITGSDGSRYRVMGSTIFSDTGETYQIIGNTLFASDGRSCIRTGNAVSCRN